MRLQQVLINLCSNAVKFTSQGEVVLSVTVAQLDEAQATLTFSVRDTGLGIAPENQARIFNGFTQAEASTTRRFGGTGLGVAISQRFVALMGGDLQLKSVLGQGSEFYFSITLPRARTEQVAETAALAPAPRMLDEPWRMLVVDDNPTARDVLARMGQSLGWTMEVAASAEQALKRLQQQAEQGLRYQAVFIDSPLSGANGEPTLQALRAATSSSATPVIAMVTPHERERLTQRSDADPGLDGFLAKPVTASMMFDAVMEARANHHPDRPSQAPVSTEAPDKVQRLRHMRLLVVEDNFVNQQVAQELLENEGATVTLAGNGQEGVEAVAAANPPFDVVLMDLQMPVMDGLTAARHIRTELKRLTLPIVAMTANVMASDRDACLAAGMNDHVGKPFDLNNLVRVLRQQAGRETTEAL
jgi:CheY-like chemotaxis protein